MTTTSPGMSAPHVSVVMAVYNGAEHLAETIDSVLAQEGVDFEFVIVDDGSTDATARVLADYAARDARVRLIAQENQGLTAGLIAGCAAARGRYIARQDCGDTSLPDRLGLQAALLDRHPDCTFVSGWTEYIGPAGEHLHVTTGTGRATIPIAILDDTLEWGTLDGPTSHPSVMFRKSAYEDTGGYRLAFRYGQDWDLWYRLAERGRFCMLEQVVVRATIAPQSISGMQKDAQHALARLAREAMHARLAGGCEAELLARAEAISRAPRARDRTKAQRAAGSYFIGQLLIRNGDAAGLKYLGLALADNPLDMRAWLAFLRGHWLIATRSHGGR